MSGFEVPLAIALAGGLGAGAAVYSSNQQASQARQAQEQSMAAQANLEKQFTDRQANEESAQNAIETRDAAQRRQKNLAIGAGGRQDTILTGPLGVAGEPATGSKTLLGT